MSQVILVWSTYTQPQPDGPREVEDHWSVHESLSEGHTELLERLELPNLHSASLCGVIASTDYSAMPEFYLG